MQEASHLEWRKRTDVLVILLGWAGANDKNLKKYSDLYAKFGFSTLRYTHLFSGSVGLYSTSEPDISELVDDFRSVWSKENTKLFFHIFSMNGVFTFSALLNNSEFPDILQRTIAITWDSCPIYEDSRDGYQQVLQFTLGQYFGDSLIGKLQASILIWFILQRQQFQRFKKYLLTDLLGILDASEATVFHQLLARNLPKHHLFLYSDADVICPSRQICEFHEYLFEKGMKVEFVNFSDSPHVEHFRKYPIQYEEAVNSFLKRFKSKL